MSKVEVLQNVANNLRETANFFEKHPDRWNTEVFAELQAGEEEGVWLYCMIGGLANTVVGDPNYFHVGNTQSDEELNLTADILNTYVKEVEELDFVEDAATVWNDEYAQGARDVIQTLRLCASDVDTMIDLDDD